MQVNEKNGIRV